MKDKSALLFMTIAILTMLVTIVGATFAYFRIFIIEGERSTMDLQSANPAGVVTFVTQTEDLFLSLTADEMKIDKVGTKYFATNDFEKKYVTESEEHEFILATASVNSGVKKYSCTYNFKVSLAQENAMNPEEYGEIVIKFAGDSKITKNQTIDIKDLIENEGVNLQGNFEELYFEENVDTSKHLTVQMYIQNTNKEQEPFIGNKNLHVIIEPAEDVFVCQEIGS